MADPFQELLAATIEHLKDLKGQGVRFVPVQETTLAALRSKPGASQSPASAATRALQPAKGVAQRAQVAPLQKQTTTVPHQSAKNQNSPSTPVPKTSPDMPAARVAGTQATTAPGGAPTPDPVPAAQTRPSAAGQKSKAEALEELRARISGCTLCPPLAAARKSIVFGVGNPEAELMFVGEAPGAEEDARGEPFVGNAGQTLTKIINAMGLSREKVYIANILKCRPDTPGQTFGNRPPTPEEMSTCVHYLHEQIDIIQPKVLVALGGVALSGLVGKTGITRLRGTWFTYRNIPLMPTYHPSYLLHQQNVADKRLVWEDMMKVMEKLQLPISEKQRRYFLK